MKCKKLIKKIMKLINILSKLLIVIKLVNRLFKLSIIFLLKYIFLKYFTIHLIDKRRNTGVILWTCCKNLFFQRKSVGYLIRLFYESSSHESSPNRK